MQQSIVYLASHYPSVSHTFMLNEVVALRRQGVSIHVVSVNTGEARTALEREEMLSTWYLKAAAVAAGARPHRRLLQQPLGYLRALGLALWLAGPDIERLLRHLFYLHEAVVLVDKMEELGSAHVHVQFGMAAASVATVASQFNISLSIAMHGPDDFQDVRFYRLKDKFKAAAFVTAIGYYARSQVCRLLPPQRWADVLVTPLGVDVGRFRRGTDRTPSDGPFRLLCVGRLVPAKGQHVLLQAMAALRRASHDVHLTLVGDGPDRPALERAIVDLALGPHVVLSGALSHDQVLRAYEQADAFVLPTFAEGIPIVLMEAMAMGLPCVSTWVDGIPEIITHDLNGLLVAPADVAALTDAVLRLMHDPAVGHRLALAARHTVVTRYDGERNAALLAAVLKERLG